MLRLIKESKSERKRKEASGSASLCVAPSPMPDNNFVLINFHWSFLWRLTMMTDVGLVVNHLHEISSKTNYTIFMRKDRIWNLHLTFMWLWRSSSFVKYQTCVIFDIIDVRFFFLPGVDVGWNRVFRRSRIRLPIRRRGRLRQLRSVEVQ